MVITFTRESSIWFKPWIMRRSQLSSQQELANKAGVSLEEVDLFENNLSVPFDTRCRRLKELLYTESEKSGENRIMLRTYLPWYLTRIVIFRENLLKYYWFRHSYCLLMFCVPFSKSNMHSDTNVMLLPVCLIVSDIISFASLFSIFVWCNVFMFTCIDLFYCKIQRA